MAAVFVDYDGTITDLDTFDVLVRRAAGAEAWAELEEELRSGRLSLRDTLSRQASYVRSSLDDAAAQLEAGIVFDPAFGPFVERCTELGHTLTIVSSGIAPLIRRALERNALAHLELVANEIEARPQGWRINFSSDSPNGTDKVGLVRAARARGERTVFIGDGWSDLEAAEASHLRYAKRGRTLERYLLREGLPFTAFAHFGEIDPARF